MWCLSQHRLHERIDSRPRRDPRLVCSELTIRGQNTAYPYLTHDKTTYAANAHRRADCGGRVRDAQRTFGSVPGQPPLKSGAPVAQRARVAPTYAANTICKPAHGRSWLTYPRGTCARCAFTSTGWVYCEIRPMPRRASWPARVISACALLSRTSVGGAYFGRFRVRRQPSAMIAQVSRPF